MYEKTGFPGVEHLRHQEEQVVIDRSLLGLELVQALVKVPHIFKVLLLDRDVEGCLPDAASCIVELVKTCPSRKCI